MATFKNSFIVVAGVAAVVLAVVVSAAENKVEDNDIDPVLENWDPPAYLKQTFPYYLSGEDYDGRPVWILEFGKWDLRSLVEAGEQKTKEFDMYADQFFYRVQRSIKERNKDDENPITSWACIFDMDGYKISQLTSIPTVTFVLRLAGKFEAGARNMEYGYLINLNFVGERLINVLRPVLGTTLARAETFGTNKASYIPKILKNIPKDSIPEWYGGSQDYIPVKVYG